MAFRPPFASTTLTDFTGRSTENDPSIVSSTIYVASTGNDTTGDGTSGNPLLTIAKAISLTSPFNGSTVTIQLQDDGPFVHPALVSEMNWITIKGTESIEDIRGISSVTSINDTGDDAGIVFVVDGATLSDDEWEGRVLHVTGVLSGNKNINVIRNVGNTIYGVMCARNTLSNTQSDPTGGDVDLLTFSEVQFPAVTVLENSVQFNYENINATGSSAFIFCNATDKISFTRCQSSVAGIIAGQGGAAYIYSSAISNSGATSGGWMAAINGGSLRIGYGLSITDKNSTAGNSWINIREAGRLVLEGLTVIRGLGTKGITADAGVIQSSQYSTGILIFEKQTATASNANGFIINSIGLGSGMFYYLPVGYGEVLSTYYVTAQLAAHVAIPSGTSVVSTGGTNWVSADNGSSNGSLADDGTLITGGDPTSTIAAEVIPFANVNGGFDTNTNLAWDVSEQMLVMTSASGPRLRLVDSATADFVQIDMDGGQASFEGTLDFMGFGQSGNWLYIDTASATISLGDEFGDTSETYIRVDNTNAVIRLLNGSMEFGRQSTAISANAGAALFVGVTSTASPRTITLPTASVLAGKTYIIKDESGGASGNNITVDTEGSETIDGAASAPITTNYGVLRVYSDGTNWFTF